MGLSIFKKRVRSLTIAQQFEIKETMFIHFGDNMQSGFNENGEPYLYCKTGPNTPLKGYTFLPDGTVTSV